MCLCLLLSLYVTCYNCLLFVKQIGMPYSCATLCEYVCVFVGEQRVRRCIIKRAAQLSPVLVCVLVKNQINTTLTSRRFSQLPHGLTSAKSCPWSVQFM